MYSSGLLSSVVIHVHVMLTAAAAEVLSLVLVCFFQAFMYSAKKLGARLKRVKRLCCGEKKHAQSEKEENERERLRMCSEYQQQKQIALSIAAAETETGTSGTLNSAG